MKTKIVTLSSLAALALSITAVPPPPLEGTYKVIAWNDLGMHCMDDDYSVFSLLPPFNTLQAQVIDGQGKLVKSTTGITVTYHAVADLEGVINTTSKGKTNYWTYATALYGGSSTPDTGLAKHDMPGPSNTPQPMKFDSSKAMFTAEGIPVTPYDDNGHKRTYPMFRITVRNASNTVLATTDVVAPVSDEMDCTLCHRSGGGHAKAKPDAGWIYHADAKIDYRLNILRKHDDNELWKSKVKDALKAAGYSAKGLVATVLEDKKPVLCAKCHASNALPGTGMNDILPLTRALHKRHARVIDPLTNKSMDDSTNRASCYRCHPGNDTRCLRGAMGGAVAADGSLAMQCQDCHGNMSAVADSDRVGWLNQPSCQNCHSGTAVTNNGQIRYTNVFETDGSLRVAKDRTFATNADVPAKGFDLYRFSTGHGGLACEACHGSTHAVYPSIHPNDNVQSQSHQNHVGTLAECTSCHKEAPDTVTGGPHGMHPIGAKWAKDHGDAAEANRAACRVCHGLDYRGTVLSRTHSTRSFTTKFGTRQFFRGATVSCYACHNGPNSERTNTNRAPVATDAAVTVGDTALAITLAATDADNNTLTYRIVQQPSFGRVALSGKIATYHPDKGFAGVDKFTFAAWDGAIDSNLGTVSVSRNANWQTYGHGYAGTGGTVPGLSLDKAPILGTQVKLQMSNSAGVLAPAGLYISTERARLSSGFGGMLLVEPGMFVTTFGLPVAGIQLPINVPNQATLVGRNIRLQALQGDVGARHWIAFSAGLEASLGR